MEKKLKVCTLICLVSPLIAYLLKSIIELIAVQVIQLIEPSGIVSVSFNVPLFYALMIGINSAVIVYVIGKNKKEN